MNHALLFFPIAALLLMSGCATLHNLPSIHRENLTFDEYVSGVRNPYHAPERRRIRIETAARYLRLETTEADVISSLGFPDFKSPEVSRDKRSGQLVEYGELWTYIVSVERSFPISPGPSKDPQDKLLQIELTNKSNPRTVSEVNGRDFISSQQ